MRSRQNGRHFADDTFKCTSLNENVWIPITSSLEFVPMGPIDNIPALVQIMAWRRPGDKPLSESMMVSLPTHICVTRPQWVKSNTYLPLFHWFIILAIVWNPFYDFAKNLRIYCSCFNLANFHDLLMKNECFTCLLTYICTLQCTLSIAGSHISVQCNAMISHTHFNKTKRVLQAITQYQHWWKNYDGTSEVKWDSSHHIIQCRPNSQIPWCTYPISHNTPFRTETCICWYLGWH